MWRQCRLLPFAAESVENRPAYFASKLKASMVGLGTNDDDLVRLVVGRAEVSSSAGRLTCVYRALELGCP